MLCLNLFNDCSRGVKNFNTIYKELHLACLPHQFYFPPFCSCSLCSSPLLFSSSKMPCAFLPLVPYVYLECSNSPPFLLHLLLHHCFAQMSLPQGFLPFPANHVNLLRNALIEPCVFPSQQINVIQQLVV